MRMHAEEQKVSYLETRSQRQRGNQAKKGNKREETTHNSTFSLSRSAYGMLCCLSIMRWAYKCHHASFHIKRVTLPAPHTLLEM